MKTILTAITCFLLTLTACLAQLSTEVMGVIRAPGVVSGQRIYGVGATVGYDFNRYVAGWVRGIGYETDDWRGGAIDEGAIGATATIFQTKSERQWFGQAKLALVGSVNRDFQNDNWGLGVGVKPTFQIYKQSYAFGQVEYRIWDHDVGSTKCSGSLNTSDLLVSAGVGLKF